MHRAAKIVPIAALIALGLACVQATAVAQHLDYHSGQVTAHPKIHVIYYSTDWDSANPAEFSRSNIEAWLQSFIGSNYFDAANQYGCFSGSYGEANQSSFDSAGSSTNSGSIALFVFGEIETPGTGVPYPCSGDDEYILMVPQGSTIDNGFNKTCDSFGAYHFFTPVAVPPLVCDVFGDLRASPYCVIPLQCATHAAGPNGFYTDFDGATMLMSHEMIEASTDPIDSFITGVPIIGDIFQFIGDLLNTVGLSSPDPAWYDGSLSLGDLFTKSEAADICEFYPTGNVNPEVWLNGSLVAAYWSNADNDRACGPGVVRNLTLMQSGIPGGVNVPVTLDGRALNVNANGGFTIQIATNATYNYAFPAMVAGGPGVQYVTTDPNASATITPTDNFSKTVNYGAQYYVTVSTNPAAAATGNGSLTPSGFYNAGTMSMSADQDVSTGTGTRLDFRSWSGSASSSMPDFTFTLSAPATETANYTLQDQLTFDQSGIPAAVPWNVSVNGTSHAGPYTDWFDDGASLTFDYQTPVPDLTAGTQYVLTGTDQSSPYTPSGPATITGSYKTQYLLTIDTSGLGSNTTHLFNSGTQIGMASDGSPFSGWFDAGTTLALSADPLVDGADGIEYFFQSFSPTPPGTLTGPFTTTATYETMAQLISNALNSGGISGPGSNGIGNSLQQKWAAITADLAAGRYAAALGTIGAFVNELQAQSGKKITTSLATTLELDALMVYHSTLCKGIAAGQVNATAAAHDYSYYSGLVTSLGGTVLPPC